MPVIVPPGLPSRLSGGPDNSYVRAFNRSPALGASGGGVREGLVPCPQACTGRQVNYLCWARLHATRVNSERWEDLNQGVTTFLLSATPTVGDLINHTQEWHLCLLRPQAQASSTIDIAPANLSAQESIHREYTAVRDTGTYGNILITKPDNVIRILYENFSSLSLFTVGPGHHRRFANSIS